MGRRGACPRASRRRTATRADELSAARAATPVRLCVEECSEASPSSCSSLIEVVGRAPRRGDSEGGLWQVAGASGRSLVGRRPARRCRRRNSPGRGAIRSPPAAPLRAGSECQPEGQPLVGRGTGGARRQIDDGRSGAVSRPDGFVDDDPIQPRPHALPGSLSVDRFRQARSRPAWTASSASSLY